MQEYELNTKFEESNNSLVLKTTTTSSSACSSSCFSSSTTKNNTKEENKLKCFQSLQQLFEKYQNDDYMMTRLQNHLINYFPKVLENEQKNHERRQNRLHYLTNEQQIFIQVFLSKNQFYYLPNNNFFYEYDGHNYKIIREDDVIHKLLSSISKDRVLLDWKHKTKFNIIKQIKERNILTSLPESATIQEVLSVFYPQVFTTKNEAKYFLTILGDNILRKSSNLIFLVSPKVKTFLAEIDFISNITIGFTNTTNNFMTKYHENHNFENCRLIKINENASLDAWKQLLKKSGLNLICVAAHYSNRYESSDNYLDTKADEESRNYSYFLKNTTQQEIIGLFTNQCIQVTTTQNNGIAWKNIHFIWKQFLSQHSLPKMIYSNTLKTKLKELYTFDEATDGFMNIASKYLPIESDFLKFWDSTVLVEEEGELEVDEICMLFKHWVKVKADSETAMLSNGNIGEKYVIEILRHFLPDIEVVDEKYVLNVQCSLWDKGRDIKESFSHIKDVITSSQDCLTLISIDQAYNHYFKFCHVKSYKFIVSKKYFEKYLNYEIAQHIVYDKFIEADYFIANY